MPTVQERCVCLAIGVANARPLDWLPGAATAARDIGEWARCSNFDEVTVLTDEPEVGQTHWSAGDAAPTQIAHPSGLAVTISRIREELLRLLPTGELTHWLVLHFAGHGLRQDSVRTLWLPTDWEPENRAIAVEALKASLDGYGIENLTLVSDACRDFANRPAIANLAADPVLPRGPMQAAQPGLDRFNAVEDGKRPRQLALVDIFKVRPTPAWDIQSTPASYFDVRRSLVQPLQQLRPLQRYRRRRGVCHIEAGEQAFGITSNKYFDLTCRPNKVQWHAE